MSEKPTVYVCIPVYYSGPEVPRVLDRLLTSIEEQDYPYWRRHIILSIQKCDNMAQYTELVRVMYKDVDIPGNPFKKRSCSSTHPMKRDVDGPAKNTNSAMQMVPPDSDVYVKLMNQDDFLDSPTAISEMVDELETSRADWLINACIHTDGEGKVRERPHYPLWPGEKNMVEGVNRFGCPSVAMFRANILPECDPKIEYAMDCDMWIQTYKKVGAPIIRNKPDVVIRMWEAQLTNQYDNIPAALERDKAYMRNKYGYQ